VVFRGLISCRINFKRFLVELCSPYCKYSRTCNLICVVADSKAELRSDPLGKLTQNPDHRVLPHCKHSKMATCQGGASPFVNDFAKSSSMQLTKFTQKRRHLNRDIAIRFHVLVPSYLCHSFLSLFTGFPDKIGWVRLTMPYKLSALLQAKQDCRRRGLPEKNGHRLPSLCLVVMSVDSDVMMDSCFVQGAINDAAGV
jgi:hypothetical protein